MVYKLYGHPMSTCANRVLIVAKEVGIDLEWHTVDLFKGEQKSEGFLRHQPFGKVPYLADTDEGLELYESRAICQYIATKAQAGHLVALPSDPDYFKKLASFQQAIFVETTMFERHGASLMYECMFKEVSGQGKADQSQIDLLVSNLESILSKQAFLAGDAITLGDLYHAPIIPYFKHMGQELLIDSRPNVSRWWQKIWDRDSVQEVMTDPTRGL